MVACRFLRGKKSCFSLVSFAHSVAREKATSNQNEITTTLRRISLTKSSTKYYKRLYRWSRNRKWYTPCRNKYLARRNWPPTPARFCSKNVQRYCWCKRPLNTLRLYCVLKIWYHARAQKALCTDIETISVFDLPRSVKFKHIASLLPF